MVASFFIGRPELQNSSNKEVNLMIDQLAEEEPEVDLASLGPKQGRKKYDPVFEEFWRRNKSLYPGGGSKRLVYRNWVNHMVSSINYKISYGLIPEDDSRYKPLLKAKDRLLKSYYEVNRKYKVQ